MGVDLNGPAGHRSGDLLGAALRQVAAANPRRRALEDVSGRSWTYEELITAIDRVATRVRDLGLTPTDRIGVVAANGPSALVAILGVLSAANAAPVSPALGAAETLPWTRRVGAGVVIAADAAHEGELGDFEIVSRRLVDPRQAREHTLLLPTSGTTGEPKIVPLSTRNLVSAARGMTGALALTPADRYLSIMPLYHIHGIVTCLATLLSGGTVVAAPGVRPTEFFAWLDRLQPTWYSASPTIHHTLVARATSTGRRVDGSTLRFIRSQSAPISQTLVRSSEALFGVPLINSYGMTEAAGQIASQRVIGDRAAGTVGAAVGCEVAIVGDDGSGLPLGREGQIAIRGESVVSGYDGPDGEKRDWFLTGDLGLLDAQGNLRITGRIRELINRGGEKVSPLEVDEALQAHPKVVTAAAFAVPDPRLGEEIGAAVVINGQASEEELQAWVGQRLAAHKVPRWIIFVEALPMVGVGKVDRPRLADLLSRSPTAGEHIVRYREAGRGIEREVAVMIADVLQLKAVGRRDNFFDFGGDSYLASVLLERIRREHGVRVPLVSLYRDPTAEGLARSVSSVRLAANTPSATTWIKLRDGVGPPVAFLMPGGNFALDPYRPLVNSLPAGWRAYGYPVQVHELGDRPLAALVRIVAESIAMTGVDEPLLIGYSSAGVVAAHVSSALLRLGVRAPRLIMIDSYSPRLLGGISLSQRVLHHWHAARRQGQPVARYAVARLNARLRGVALRAPLNRRPAARIASAGALLIRDIRRAEVGPIAVPTLLVRASHAREMFDDPLLGWGTDIVHIERRCIDSTHATIIADHSEEIVGLVTTWLSRA